MSNKMGQLSRQALNTLRRTNEWLNWALETWPTWTWRSLSEQELQQKLIDFIAVDEGRTPSEYKLLLNSKDYGQLAGTEKLKSSLEQRLAEHLVQASALDRYPSGNYSRPKVTVEPDPKLRVHQVRVQAGRKGVSTPPSQEPPSHRAEQTIRTPAPPRPRKVVPPPAELRPLRRKHETRVYPLGNDITSLGRSMNNDIVLSSKRVSRQHAQITWRDGHYCLVDLGSTSPTYLNGERVVDERVLVSGNQIKLGDVRMVFTVLKTQGS